MNTVDENKLQNEESVDPNELANMVLRIITAPITGTSKVKKISELILKVSNISGLQSYLDAKQVLKTGYADFLTAFDATGQTVSSSYKKGTYSTIEAMNAITTDGLYKASVTGEAINDVVMGYVYFVVIGNGTQILFTSRGLWFRSYSGSWSFPVYVGGSVANIVVTYSEAEGLIASNSLSVGSVYSINDFETTGYEKVILTAASSNSFFQEGYAFLPVINTDALISEYGDNFIGEWNDSLFSGSWSDGYVVTCYGRIYVGIGDESHPGAGALTNWKLDTVHWRELDPIIYAEYFTVAKHRVVYDFVNNYVLYETNDKNVTAGEGSVPSDVYQARFNDWGFDIGSNITCRRFRKGADGVANSCKNINITGDIENINASGHGANPSSCCIDGAYGSGSLKNIKLVDIFLSVNLSNDAIINDIDIGKTYPQTPIHISVSGRTFSHNLGSTDYQFESVSLPNNKVSASYVIGAGSFTLSTGGWVSPTVVTGCVKADGRVNGIITSGTTVADGSFTVKYAGYYRLRRSTSATVSAATTIETMAYKNGTTAITEWYNKKYYANVDSWKDSTLPDYPVLLAEGDVITVKFQVGNPVTVTLGQINMTLEYDN